MHCWQRNLITFEKKRLITSMLQWKFWYTGLNRLPYWNEGNVRCTCIEPDQWQLNGLWLNARGQSSNWSAKSLRCHLLNTSFLINYSTIMCHNYYNMPELAQPVPEAHSPKGLSKGGVQPKKSFMGQ
jgi:hypothetical protein